MPNELKTIELLIFTGSQRFTFEAQNRAVLSDAKVEVIFTELGI